MFSTINLPIQVPFPQPLIGEMQSVPLQMQIESVLLSAPGWTVSSTTILYKEITNDYEFLTYSYIDWVGHFSYNALPKSSFINECWEKEKKKALGW